MSNSVYFQILKNASLNYVNFVDYDLIPAIGNGYNSNSFTAGIIEATGGKAPIDMSALVGGRKLLPKNHFGY